MGADRRSWDERYVDLLERIMATGVANLDPAPLQREMERLMAERPKETSQDGKPSSTRGRAKR